MNLIKKVLVLMAGLMFFVTSSPAFLGLDNIDAFQQMGLEEENTRLSIALLSSKSKDDDTSITIQSQLGTMIYYDAELLIDLNVFSFGKDYTATRMGAGINYYFAKKNEKIRKSETFIPYMGTQIGFNTSSSGSSTAVGLDDRFYVGAHQFVDSHTAITPEAGLQFIDLVDYQQVYFNIYLTFFFDFNK